MTLILLLLLKRMQLDELVNQNQLIDFQFHVLLRKKKLRLNAKRQQVLFPKQKSRLCYKLFQFGKKRIQRRKKQSKFRIFSLETLIQFTVMRNQCKFWEKEFELELKKHVVGLQTKFLVRCFQQFWANLDFTMLPVWQLKVYGKLVPKTTSNPLSLEKISFG